jgi:hypothetical protein
MKDAGRTPWEVLGVAEDAPLADVKRAFFRRARETHPDASGGDAGAFREVQGAYETLMSTALREERRQTRPRRTTRYNSWVPAATSSHLWIDEDPLAEFFCAARKQRRPDEFASVLAREMGWGFARG